MIPEPPENESASQLPVERHVELLVPGVGAVDEPSRRDPADVDRRERIRHYARAPRRP